MKSLHILVVDDEPAVLDAVLHDLEELEDHFPIETAGSAAEARKVVERLKADNMLLGVILCDHRMPGETGVQFLIDLHSDPFTRMTRKILLTGQAGLKDTIEAINHGGLAQYIAKPWDPEILRQTVREQLTHFVLNSKLSPRPWMQKLDPMLLNEAIHKGYLGDA